MLGDGWLAFQGDDLDTVRLAGLLETLEDLREEGGRLDEPFSRIMRLHSSSEMAPRLPEIAVQVRDLGFDELIVNLPWEDLTRAEGLIDEVRSAVATDGDA